ncbi:MAG TPA: sigma-70 family RNA polymerase sigma factor [Pyrinomonadaceae bacterium]|nr:sigma-70 family RNA polymerase sigma factor [Pyrinomonadaceae bacterium]
MKGQSNLTQAAFDSLLAWLDADREQAGMKYEQIRRRLIKIFTCRGRADADELADETINRVTLKAQELSKDYDGDPSLYFYGVAQKVFLESLRKRPAPAFVPPPPPPTASETDEDEAEYECLESCVGQLPPESRVLVIEYYQNDRRAKIDHRKELAARLGIAPNALRIRAHRIRLTLQRCVEACLAQKLPA